MASYTTNLNLKKPAGSENVAIGDINNNMDTIDTAYGTLNSKITNQFGSLALIDLGTINGSGGTITLTTVNGTKALVMTFGTNAKTALISINAPNASNAYALKTSGAGADITVSTSGMDVTITNTTQYSCTAVALLFSQTLTKA